MDKGEVGIWEGTKLTRNNQRATTRNTYDLHRSPLLQSHPLPYNHCPSELSDEDGAEIPDADSFGDKGELSHSFV